MTGTRCIGVAIPIPEPWGSELQRWRDRFGDPQAGAIPTHVTLVPPTEIVTSRVDGLDAHLRAVAARTTSFGIRLHGTGSFRPVSPVVFVQVAEGISPCEELQREVRSGPLKRPLPFPYHPHVTIAHDLPEDVLDRASDELADYRAGFRVDGFALYEHGPDAVWRPRQLYEFGGRGPGAGTAPAAGPTPLASPGS